MYLNIVGVDPGVNGAISLIVMNGEGLDYKVEYFLAENLKYNDENKIMPSPIEATWIWHHCDSEVDLITLEKPLSGYTKGGNLSASGKTVFSSLSNYGRLTVFIEEIVGGYIGAPYAEIPPATWKKHMGVSSKKESCIEMVIEKFGPKIDDLLPSQKQKREGIAESLLIGWYGYEQWLLARHEQMV